ncbi:MAG TPA: 30S ribosomal protein S20 [Candidatus Eisenbacteria bacterium]|nr:30S ribosomal protein S20 [Candidatus Eisenbacteria bacterium]
MPVIKSAKKKLKQDKKRTLVRAKTESFLKDAVKKAVASPTAKTVSVASSLLDKAAKKHIIHKNKAARVKSRLAHLLSPKKSESKTETVKSATKTVKKAVKEKSAKGRSSSGRKK